MIHCTMSEHTSFCLYELRRSFAETAEQMFKKARFEFINLHMAAGFVHNSHMLEEKHMYTYVKFDRSYLQIRNVKYASFLKKYLYICNIGQSENLESVKYTFSTYLDTIVPKCNEHDLDQMINIIDEFEQVVKAAEHAKNLFEKLHERM